MTTIVPVLPCTVLRMPVGRPVPPDAALLLAARMVQHHLMLKLLAAGYEVGDPLPVLRGCMVRTPPDYDRHTPWPLVEVTFPHPGGDTTRDPYEVTPEQLSNAELVGGPDDGTIIPMSNLAPDRYLAPYYGAQEPAWADEPGQALTVAAPLCYTRTGYDLATGYWRYSYQGG